MKNGYKNLQIGILASLTFCLGTIGISAIEHWNENPKKNPRYTVNHNIVKTPLHFFLSEEYHFSNPKDPGIVACYDEEKRPSRILVSTKDNGVYDQKFTMDGTKCALCHFPFESQSLSERRFKYQIDM